MMGIVDQIWGKKEAFYLLVELGDIFPSVYSSGDTKKLYYPFLFFSYCILTLWVMNFHSLVSLAFLSFLPIAMSGEAGWEKWIYSSKSFVSVNHI